MVRTILSALALAFIPFASAAAQTCPPGTDLEGPCAVAREDLRLNDLQAVGSHNSYKRFIPAPELAIIKSTSPDAAIALDYGHRPLTEQLDLGMRQIELDLFHDPEGGRYADPALPKATKGMPGAGTFDPAPMAAPGFKVLHAQDVDVYSSCATFVICLQEIKAWSDAHPRHVPILIMMNAKDAPIDNPEAVVPLPFDAAAYDALDAEVLSVFPRDRIVMPDDVRGDSATLREGVLAGGWPTLEAARGKVLFALDEGPAKTAVYRRGNASLEGLPLFVNAHDETAPHAAYFTLNNPLTQGERIRAAVTAGFLVRTRADANTLEARAGDTGRRDAAFASGAHYVSTDYYLPREDFGPYRVRLPGGAPARCNPVRRDDQCAAR
ncbi:MAG: phosphatidylinositol-specific phospholipase C1-like protein [Alphaproteobacteria bacterium]